MKRIIALLMIVRLTTTFTFGQITETQTLSGQLLIDDFNTFIRYLEETHPDPYTSFGGLPEFKRIAQGLRNKITDNTTVTQLEEMMKGFISVLNDGHTVIHERTARVRSETDSYLLPLRLSIATDGVFISETDNNNIQCKGPIPSVRHIILFIFLRK